MEIYLCDDNSTQLAELKRLADDTACETDQVYSYTTSEALFQMLSNGDASNACVISDIELAQEGEGLQLAREINRLYPRIRVILCTAYLDYAKELWNVDLCSFLTKPIEAVALRYTIEKARKTFAEDILSITHRGGVQRVSKRDIRYIERRGRASFLHLAPGVDPIQTSETLEQLCKRLDSRAFYKIHRSCLVNLDYVEYIQDKELHLYGVDIILTVSRPWRKNLILALADYGGEGDNESV